MEFKPLIDELSAGISDLTEAAKDGNTTLSEIASALADMNEALGKLKRGESLEAVAKAIKDVKINVNVSPTPLTITPVVQIMEKPAGRIVIDHSYDSTGRVVRSIVYPEALSKK